MGLSTTKMSLCRPVQVKNHLGLDWDEWNGDNVLKYER